MAGAGIPRRHLPPWWLPAAVVAVAAGALVPLSMLAPVILIAGAIAAVVVAQGQRATTLFLVALFGLLVGYAFLGRGFAYVGVAPLYLGEAVLALAALALIAALPRRRLTLMHGLLIAFIVWGAARTLPYVGTYGIDALRDGAAWGYAGFAVVVSLLLQQNHVRAMVAGYARVLPLLVIWIPVLAIAWYEFGHLLPLVPGTNVKIPFFKPGDMAVHLAGAAAFLLAGLYSHTAWRRLSEPLLWFFWLGGVAVASAMNRGGMLAVMLGTAAVLVFVRSFDRWIAVFLSAILVLTIATVLDVEIDVGRARTISIGQLLDNVESVISESEDSSLSGTREWREEWWDTIVGYTVHGPYFWGGKGYGVNLAQDDGFRSTSSALRAPHNAHLQFLARGGIPGLALWIALLGMFAFVLLRSAYRCLKRGDRYWLGIHAWIFVYWLAATINMTFDVYIEGPQGGILFWSLYGAGLAVVAITPSARVAHRQPARRSGSGGAGPAALLPSPWVSSPAAMSSVICRPGQIDINAAGIGALVRLAHVGPYRARLIVRLRPFASVDDLRRVPGIGRLRLARIKAQGLACAR